MTEPWKSDCPGDVWVAWCHGGQVDGSFMDSMLLMYQYDRRSGANRIAGHLGCESSPRLVAVRNMLVEKFLEGSGDYLLMVDTDMTFDADSLERLLEAHHRTSFDIIGGLCFTGGRGAKPAPTIYYFEDTPEGQVCKRAEVLPDDARMVRCHATGAAFLLMPRYVLEKMDAAYATLLNGKPNPNRWFVDYVDPNTGQDTGEDIGFCRRVCALGFSVGVRTDVEVGHIKTEVITRQTWDDFQSGRRDIAPAPFGAREEVHA